MYKLQGQAFSLPWQAKALPHHCTVSSRSIRHPPEALLSRDREGAVGLKFLQLLSKRLVTGPGPEGARKRSVTCRAKYRPADSIDV
jgi:hypothetical protein